MSERQADSGKPAVLTDSGRHGTGSHSAHGLKSADPPFDIVKQDISGTH